MLKQSWNSTDDIQADKFDPFSRHRMPQIWKYEEKNVPKYGPRGQTTGPNRLKIAYWPHKSAWTAYFKFDGVEQNSNTTGESGQTMLGFFQAKMVQELAL